MIATYPVVARTAATRPLTLDDRLALRGLAMDDRLAAAGARIAVTIAPIEIPVVDPGPPIIPAWQPTYATPVAQLLERAAHQIQTGGWCRRWLTAENGAVCLLGSIRAAGGGSGHEAQAEEVLLGIIRQEFPDAQTIGGWNDGQRDGRPALRMLNRAARHASRHGI